MGVFVLGSLTTSPASQRRALLADPTFAALETLGWLDLVGVVEIDPDVSDTARTQEAYELPPGPWRTVSSWVAGEKAQSAWPPA